MIDTLFRNRKFIFMKWSSGMLQSLTYFGNENNKVLFLFHSSFISNFPLTNSLIVNIGQDINLGKNIVVRKWKTILRFSCDCKYMAFEVFCWAISSSINHLFLKRERVVVKCQLNKTNLFNSSNKVIQAIALALNTSI